MQKALVVVWLLAASAAALRDRSDGGAIRNSAAWDEDELHWAIVIAGSSGWWNYRHQADACHAYQVLRRGGLHPSRIVVMIYDDIAHYGNNPKPGQVFNRPGGANVYAGIRPDYKGDDVNAANFLAVLEGNEAAVAGIGSGKVVKSGPQDRVFVFYSDHGSPGVLGMPSGNFLYADDLLHALQRKRAAGGYGEVVMYVEACESGSMFEGLLPPDMGVYVATASNAEESSWGTYCPGMDPGPAEGFDTCLGDLFSVAWMEDSEWQDLSIETLAAQFEYVRARTSNNYTYAMGSHAMQYGQIGLTEQPAGDYLGMNNRGWPPEPLKPSKHSHEVSEDAWSTAASADASATGPSTVAGAARWQTAAAARRARRLVRRILSEGEAGTAQGAHTPKRKHSKTRAGDKHHAVPQRDADLMTLRTKVARAPHDEARHDAQAALDAEVSRRRAVDAAAESMIAQLLTLRGASDVLLTNLGWTQAQVLEPVQGSPANEMRPVPRFVKELVGGRMGRPAAGKPLVDSWDCLRSMVAAWSDACGPMDQYSMRHTRMFANLCNAGVNERALGEVAARVCGNTKLPPAAQLA